MIRRAVAPLLVAPLLAACDPVHDSAVAALGPEAPGVPHGPLHRPGQPCTYCHQGGFRNPPLFTVAGTIFETPGDRVGVDGAMVVMVDAKGNSVMLATNEAGNFYTRPEQFDPTYPIQVSIGFGGRVTKMQTLIEGNGTVEPNGSCASCHFGPPGPRSPGHVCLTLDDGGTPP